MSALSDYKEKLELLDMIDVSDIVKSAGAQLTALEDGFASDAAIPMTNHRLSRSEYH